MCKFGWFEIASAQTSIVQQNQNTPQIFSVQAQQALLFSSAKHVVMGC
jgi:hypothetical protein